MGYTTKFTGQFTLDKPLTLEHASVLNALAADSWTDYDFAAYPGTNPGGYCQWEPTRDRLGIVWNGGEKFYDYKEWLQYIIDALLKPWGYTLTGEVTYQGEDINDRGILRVLDGKVVCSKEPIAAWRSLPKDTREGLLNVLKEMFQDRYDVGIKIRAAFQSAIEALKEPK